MSQFYLGLLCSVCISVGFKLYSLRYSSQDVRQVVHLLHLIILRLVHLVRILAYADTCSGVRLDVHCRNGHLGNSLVVLVLSHDVAFKRSGYGNVAVNLHL